MRTLSALGPENLSAASAAMGWIMVFSSWLDRASIGAASKAYILWSLSGNRFEGKELSVVALAPVKAASSLPRPANSRAPNPRTVSTDARCPIE